MTVKMFIQLVAQTRNYQKKYFKTRGKKELTKALESEYYLDKVLKEFPTQVTDEEQITQLSMFKD